MRTKTLLLTAALSAAGVATSLAQGTPVYSVNVVGYINLTLTPGFHMIANQLDNKNGNMLNDLITTAPIGTTIYKFDPAAGYVPSIYTGADWQPNASLNPGEGAFINVGEATTITFVGEVMNQSTVALPANFSIASSAIPQAAPLTDLDFPADVGDTVYFFRSGAYAPSIFDGTQFQPEATPAVGEAFFVNKSAAANWSQTFSVNQ
jgi:hypothetical protein